MCTILSIRKSNTELQQAIISASFVKQTWFFYETANKYLDMVELLNVFTPETEMQLDTFHMPAHYFGRLECPCLFAAIEVKDNITKKTLTENCLHVLGQVISLVDEKANLSLRERCARLVLVTLNQGSLEEKTLSLMFFAQFLKLATELSLNLEHLVVEILTIVEISLERFNRWLSSGLTRSKSLEQFKTVLTDFYAKLNGVPFINGFTEYRQKLLQRSIGIIKTLLALNKDGEDLKFKLIEQIKKFLRVLLNRDGSDAIKSGYEEIFSLCHQLPELLNLLEVPITNEIVQNSNLDEANIFEESHVWKSVMNILNDAKDKPNATQTIVIRQRIIHLAVNINHNYFLWKQKNNFREKTLQIFGSNTQKFVEEMFEEIPNVSLNSEVYLTVLECCADLVNLEDFQLLNEHCQKQVCSWFFVPFVGKTNITLICDRSLENDVVNSQSETNLRTLQIRSLDQLCTLSCDYMAESASTELKTNLWAVVRFIMDSDHVEQKKTFLNFYQNLMLSLKFHPEQLARTFLLPSLAISELQLAAAKNLNAHICLKSCNFQLFQVKGETTTLKRKFRCFVCKPSADESDITSTQTSTSQSRQLFAQSQGVLVSTRNSEQFAQFEISIGELEQVYRSQHSETRIAAVGLLTVLLKHTEMAIDEKIVLAWSDLITCNTIEVCITFAKTFGILMECVMVCNVVVRERKPLY